MYDDDHAPLATMGEAHREWHSNAGVPMGTPGCPQDACHPVDDYDWEPEPTIRCGNRAYHESVGTPAVHRSAAEVRECYAHSGRFKVQAAPVAQAPAPVAPAAPVDRYAPWASIPVGTGDYANYALQDGEHVRFYRVERPSEGKWAGKTYLKRYVSDDLVKTSWAETCNALDAIAADPQAAAVLYGRETKRCAICHRKLTDDKNKGSDGLTSLERGIGPVCMTKVGG